MKLEWYWDFPSEKECWLAAISLLYDGKLDEVETFDSAYENEFEYIDDNSYIEVRFREITRIRLRPIHSHRWLAEIYEEGQKWEKQIVLHNGHSRWSGCFVQNEDNETKWLSPGFKKIEIEYRPHPELEPELFKWYEENKP